jgi:hypothetical protein
MRGTWQTTDGGGSGLGVAVLVVLAVALLGPAVAAAVAELVHALIIIAIVLLGMGAAGLVAAVAFRLRQERMNKDARVRPAPPPWRPVQARREPRALSPTRPRAVGQAPREVHVHHHWHGVSGEEVAAIIQRQNR